MNSVNGAAPGPDSTAQQHQPQVRHIPIYVEGRDEPLLNKSSAPQRSSSDFGPTVPPPHPHQSHRAATEPSSAFGGQGSIFDRVKSFPVRSGLASDLAQGRPGFSSAHQQQRTQSPARATSVPVQMPSNHHSQSSSASSTPTDASIVKIQAIQRDVLALMDQVEQFQGTSKKDKQYLYLDEMLTQNLLKLDTIDTDGKENIKQARREAIKCINICIAALERKTEEAAAATLGGRQQ